MPYIDKNELLNGIYSDNPEDVMLYIARFPTADVVGQSVVDQIRWERDTAIAQLAEIGKGFGETMDDVVERKVGKWIEYPECLKYEYAYSDDHIVCSECHHVWSVIDNYTETFNFCPNCGADMRKETEDDKSRMDK